MKVLGITGGVGSGKSRGSWIIWKEHMEAYVCQMDEVAKRIAKKEEKPCFRKIVDTFGEAGRRRLTGN